MSVKSSEDLPYDPEQKLEVTKSLAKNYRGLDLEGKNVNDLREVHIHALIEGVERADHLFTSVKRAKEALLDSEILLKTLEIGAAKARALKSGTGSFSIDEFISKLVRCMGGTENTEDTEDDAIRDGNGIQKPFSWNKIGRKALAKRPLSIQQKRRNVGQRKNFTTNKADERMPEELSDKDIGRATNETTRNVLRVRYLSYIVSLSIDAGPINLFKFFVDPDDFGQSVENLFHLSFLIRDGKCALVTNEDEEPEICEPYADISLQLGTESNEDKMEGNIAKHQAIIDFDMNAWRRAIEVFDITEPVVPHRPQTVSQGDKWYG
ncbi:Nse4 C-terminal-domain-containing protein [Abortiporus biennis]|nr:Nse4 C-terminal-domain-containing protein [Abortiporus biennis]